MTDEERREAERLGIEYGLNPHSFYHTSEGANVIAAFTAGYAAACEAKRKKLKDEEIALINRLNLLVAQQQDFIGLLDQANLQTLAERARSAELFKALEIANEWLSDEDLDWEPKRKVLKAIAEYEASCD